MSSRMSRMLQASKDSGEANQETVCNPLRRRIWLTERRRERLQSKLRRYDWLLTTYFGYVNDGELTRLRKQRFRVIAKLGEYEGLLD